MNEKGFAYLHLDICDINKQPVKEATRSLSFQFALQCDALSSLSRVCDQSDLEACQTLGE